jgi:hypothetical protein
MTKRDPEKTARNRIITEISSHLKSLLPEMLKETGIVSEQSFNGLFGGKYADYIDIKNEIIYSPDHFVSLYLSGFKNYIENCSENSAHIDNFELLKNSKKLKEYLYHFLKRTYLRNYESLSKSRPKIEAAELWIGQNNANYGLLITPRFNKIKQQWENDKSEIRHFKPSYWSIGHVLETGLCIPGKSNKIEFSSVDDYLSFFQNVIVRNSGSQYEYELARMYTDYVKAATIPEKIPLLIPELRYDGPINNHKYRLDFCIIEPNDFNKIGIELSPWSSHGYLTKTKSLTQKEINQLASDNFENEMKKHKDYFRKFGIFVLIYTDSDITNMINIFNDLQKYLVSKEAEIQLQYHIIDELLS